MQRAEILAAGAETLGAGAEILCSTDLDHIHQIYAGVTTSDELVHTLAIFVRKERVTRLQHIILPFSNLPIPTGTR